MYNGCVPLPDNPASNTTTFVNQLNQIKYMTNNARTPNNYHSQQDMRKLANGKSSNITSLPRHASNCTKQQQQHQQESSLTNNHIYSQPIQPNGVGSFINTTPKFNTADRHIVRLTQDHFNHNNSTALKYPKIYSQTLDGDYLHNNSHYSLPLDHSIPSDDQNASPSRSPTPPTPPPPALPLRNGSCNTTGRRSTLSALNGNGVINNNNTNTHSGASLHKNNALNINNNNNNNHTGSLRHQYH